LAAIELLIQAAETTVVALCAAHPALEHELRPDLEPSPTGLPIDRSIASPASATAFTGIDRHWTSSSASVVARSTTTNPIYKAHRESKALAAPGPEPCFPPYRDQAARAYDHHR
jgi:hypothetical protein